MLMFCRTDVKSVEEASGKGREKGGKAGEGKKIRTFLVS